METRTLLTVVALMLAGIVTILLVRTDGSDVGNIFSSNYPEASRTVLHVPASPHMAKSADVVKL